MESQSKRRPPRTPLTPEELIHFIKLKKLRHRRIIERFKQTKTYKILNTFNIICVVIYSELIISFLGVCNYTGHYIKSVNVYTGDEVKGGKHVYNRIIITTVNDVEYDVNVSDTLAKPEPYTRFFVGKDWIFQKEVKVKYSETSDSYVLKVASSMMFISCLMGIITFSAFGYNLNEISQSLKSISIINGLSMISFLLF